MAIGQLTTEDLQIVREAFGAGALINALRWSDHVRGPEAARAIAVQRLSWQLLWSFTVYLPDRVDWASNAVRARQRRCTAGVLQALDRVQSCIWVALPEACEGAPDDA